MNDIPVPWDVLGDLWDTEGFTWDMDVIPETSNKHMSQIKLAVSSISDEDLLTLVETICNCCTGNVNFPTPNPTLIAMTAAATAGRTSLAAELQAHDLAKLKTTERKTTMATLRAMTVQFASYVDNTSAGDAAKIESAGLQVRKTPTPVGPINPPNNLKVLTGPSEGDMRINWTNPKHSVSCELQQCNGSPTATWESITITTRGKYSVSGLTPGSQYSFRIRAIGTAGPSPWSDPVSKKAV